jgi:hypothetical protein
VNTAVGARTMTTNRSLPARPIFRGGARADILKGNETQKPKSPRAPFAAAAKGYSAVKRHGGAARMKTNILARANPRNKIHLITTIKEPAAATSEGGRANV